MTSTLAAVWVRILRERPLRWIILPICALQCLALICVAVDGRCRTPDLETLRLLVGCSGILPFYIGLLLVHGLLIEAHSLLIPNGIRPLLIAVAQLLALAELVPGTVAAWAVGLDPIASAVVLVAAITAGFCLALLAMDCFSRPRLLQLSLVCVLPYGICYLIVVGAPSAWMEAILSPLYAHATVPLAERLRSDALLLAMAGLLLAELRVRIRHSMRLEFSPIRSLEVGTFFTRGIISIRPYRFRTGSRALPRSVWQQLRHCAGMLPGRLGNGGVLVIAVLMAAAAAVFGWCWSMAIAHGEAGPGPEVPAVLFFVVISIQWLLRSDAFQAAEAVRADLLRPWTRGRFITVVLGACLWTSLLTIVMIAAPFFLTLAFWVRPHWSWLPWLLAPIAAQPAVAALLAIQYCHGNRVGKRLGIWLTAVCAYFGGAILVMARSDMQQALIRHPIGLDLAMLAIGLGGLLALRRWLMRADFA